MVSRFDLWALGSLFGLAASLACSAQGDQQTNDIGNNGGTTGNGGSTIVGGTSSTSNGGTIPIGATTGSGATSGAGGTQGGRVCAGQGTRLKGILRDFQPGPTAHPDFEPHLAKPTAQNFYNQIELGIVQPFISDEVNRKPVYAGGATGTNTTNGPGPFESWFRDTPGLNMSIEYYLDFVPSEANPSIYVFDKSPFLPINDGPNCPVMPQTPCLLGNSTNYMTGNWAMTFEFHTKFVYQPGMSFTFSGDDDVWVFVNGQLVIDLGGIHQRADGTVHLDQGGLTPGNEYILDFFWAERHVTASNFRIETSLEVIGCSIDVPR